jgi:hypothetical protein
MYSDFVLLFSMPVVLVFLVAGFDRVSGDGKTRTACVDDALYEDLERFMNGSTRTRILQFDGDSPTGGLRRNALAISSI